MEDLKSTLTKLVDRIEVERLPKTMPWAMDSGDRELGLPPIIVPLLKLELLACRTAV